jgi:hypothetical protein
MSDTDRWLLGASVVWRSLMLAELLTIELLQVEEVQRTLEGIREHLRGDRLVEPWERVVEYTANTVRDIVREDVYWRGQLYGSIEGEVHVVGDEISGIIYSDKLYAPFQERGTDPYFPNVEALEEWAEDHDISPYLVALAISRRGLEPKKFMEYGLKDTEEQILELVGNVVAEIMEAEY